MRLAVAVFKFFASLRLAIFLLLALALVFAVGTFIESGYGTETAKLVVYRSPWMSLLLILLALNVLAAALDRLPWQQKHVGFVTTHAGIILLLAGALVTRAYGMEGQMAVAEGETAGRILLNETMLQIFSPDKDPSLGFYSIPARAFPWRGREALRSSGFDSAAPPKVRLLSYYPKARREEKIKESSNGPAALQVFLESSFMKVNHWLILDDPERSRILLGPAELRFTRERFAPEKASDERGLLEFQFKHSVIKVPLPEKVPLTPSGWLGAARSSGHPPLVQAALPLEGTPYQVTILRILKDAVVEGNQLLDQSQAWNNPACELMLEGGGLKEKHTVFSKFPDFPTVHGMKPSRAGVRIYYRRPEEGNSGGPKNELRFVWQGGDLPLYQVRKGKEISEGAVSLGQEVPTGWMDFKFRVEHSYPHATVDAIFSEASASSESEENLSAVQVELDGEGETKTFWLGQGDKKNIFLGNEPFQIAYGLRTLPLGFRIELRDFRMETYPGTNRPAGFESDVTLKDDSSGTAQDLTIRMNQPLKHRGFKVFQSGYQQPEGEPEVSIFTVAKDPGILTKYMGAIVLIGGVLTMFYSRRFSNRENRGKEALPTR